jgi:HK97 family phage major capsid protein
MDGASRTVPRITALPTTELEADADPNASTRHKVLSKIAFGSQTMKTATVAGILPLADEWLEDATIDLWPLVRDAFAADFAMKLDTYTLIGTGKPAQWADFPAIIPGAIAAGNVAYEDSIPGDLGEDLNQTIAMVEEDGFNPSRILAPIAIRSRLRGLRDQNGQLIYSYGTGVEDAQFRDLIYGIPTLTMDAGAAGFTKSDATAVVGDFNRAVIGVRNVAQFTLSNTASVHLEDGSIWSAYDSDSTFLRYRVRVGYSLEIPAVQGLSGAFPFAVLKPGEAPSAG